MFEIAEANGVQQGTKIVLHLKDDCKEFSSEDRVKGAELLQSLKPQTEQTKDIYINCMCYVSCRGCHKVQQLCQLDRKSVV